jgi:hypothetical protein
MKSAYELAMERHGGGEAEAGLTDEQKAELREIDQKYQARIAEKEIFLNQRIAEAQAEGKADEIESIRQQLRNERTRLEEEREAEREKVRGG